eukprot:COSAG02_NODE_41352_length_395_cov_1.054054_1_plen_24_part_10
MPGLLPVVLVLQSAADTFLLSETV